MTQITEEFTARAREFAASPDTTTLVEAIRLFPALDNAEITLLMNHILETAPALHLTSGDVLKVLYDYVLKDEMGTQNTPSEQEARIRYCLGLSDDQFRDFIHTCSIHDF